MTDTEINSTHDVVCDGIYSTITIRRPVSGVALVIFVSVLLAASGQSVGSG